MRAEIVAGDHVIVYSSRDQIASIIVTPSSSFQSKFGFFRHDDMVGVKWGSKFPSANGRGFVYLLRPTPELWTLAVPHRTQILYLPDIAFITSFLDIKAGSRVIEAGTGSGSLSHSLARTVGAKGKVYSFEFHEERYEKARVEFDSHGLDGVIQLKHQDVYKHGFELIDEVDSVFLDLPAPWQALAHAKAALRKDRQSRICCFSPCIEQVLRTVSALTEEGFSDITSYETLIRSHDPALALAPDISVAIERIKEVEDKKGRRRVGQIRDAKKKRELKEAAKKAEEEAAAAVLVAESGAAEASTSTPIEVDPSTSTLPPPSKSPSSAVLLNADAASTSQLEATEPTATKRKRNEDAADDAGEDDDEEGTSTPAGEGGAKASSKPTQSIRRVPTSKPSGLTRGHTSFLTFATLRPSPVLESATNGTEKEVVKREKNSEPAVSAEPEIVTNGSSVAMDEDEPAGVAAQLATAPADTAI